MVTRYRANFPTLKQWLMHGSGQFEEMLVAIFRPQKTAESAPESDHKTTLAGKRKPNDYAVPSIFLWKRGSPKIAKAALSA